MSRRTTQGGPWPYLSFNVNVAFVVAAESVCVEIDEEDVAGAAG